MSQINSILFADFIERAYDITNNEFYKKLNMKRNRDWLETTSKMNMFDRSMNCPFPINDSKLMTKEGRNLLYIDYDSFIGNKLSNALVSSLAHIMCRIFGVLCYYNGFICKDNIKIINYSTDKHWNFNKVNVEFVNNVNKKYGVSNGWGNDLEFNTGCMIYDIFISESLLNEYDRIGRMDVFIEKIKKEFKLYEGSSNKFALLFDLILELMTCNTGIPYKNRKLVIWKKNNFINQVLAKDHAFFKSAGDHHLKSELFLKENWDNTKSIPDLSKRDKRILKFSRIVDGRNKITTVPWNKVHDILIDNILPVNRDSWKKKHKLSVKTRITVEKTRTTRSKNGKVKATKRVEYSMLNPQESSINGDQFYNNGYLHGFDVGDSMYDLFGEDDTSLFNILDDGYDKFDSYVSNSMDENFNVNDFYSSDFCF